MTEVKFPSRLLQEHYDKNYKLFMKKAQGLLGDFHYGQDCVQEAYEKALLYRNNFDEERGDFNKWFNSIFFNCMKKYSNFIRDKGINMSDELQDVENFPMSLAQKYPKTIMREIMLFTKNTLLQDTLVSYLLLGYRSDELEYLLGTSPTYVHKNSHLFKVFLMAKYKE
jgi:DNA-directed RNA polymerase specialized sigma24 family protein